MLLAHDLALSAKSICTQEKVPTNLYRAIYSWHEDNLVHATGPTSTPVTTVYITSRWADLPMVGITSAAILSVPKRSSLETSHRENPKTCRSGLAYPLGSREIELGKPPERGVIYIVVYVRYIYQLLVLGKSVSRGSWQIVILSESCNFPLDII